MNKEFEGVYPALITPMDSDGILNESALRKVIEFNISSGVHGFWVEGVVVKVCYLMMRKIAVLHRL